MRVRRTTRVIEGEKFPAFTVEMKGQLPGPSYGSAEVELFFHLFDSEKHEDLEPLVFSSFDVFQEEAESSSVFQSRLGPLEMSGEQYYPDWTEMFDFPLFCLGFPRKGQRQLRLRMVSILADGTVAPTMFEYGYPASGGDVVYGSAETTFDHEVTELGWLDENRNRPRVRALTIQLALHIAAADGNMNKSEAGVVKDWVKNIVSRTRSSKSEEIKSQLNAATQRSFKEASEGHTALRPICNSLEVIATEYQKYDALKLCIAVMSADGKADESELKELDQIVSMLGLDPEQYRKMLDPHLATVDPNMGAAVTGNSKALLGIQDGMTEEEIRKILTDANKKWFSRVTADDPAIRERAKEMLDLIADLREEFFGGSGVADTVDDDEGDDTVDDDDDDDDGDRRIKGIKVN